MMLTASSLRANAPMLSELKERLCILWGDLEEQKSALLKKQNLSSIPPPSSFDEPFSSAVMNISAQPNVESDEENDVALKSSVGVALKPPLQQRDFDSEGAAVSKTSARVDPYYPDVKNKAFTCCIRQFGVRVDEEDQSKANAGNSEDGTGKRWERRFGLFGVTIV